MRMESSGQSLAVNIETRLTQATGLTQVRNLTSETPERAVNLRSKAIASHPEFITRGGTSQNHCFWQINLETVHMVRGEKPEAETSQECRNECSFIFGEGDLEIYCVP